MLRKVWGEITYPFPNLNGYTVEVSEWISNSITYFMMDVITYPCWDKSQSMFVKGARGIACSSRIYRYTNKSFV